MCSLLNLRQFLVILRPQRTIQIASSLCTQLPPVPIGRRIDPVSPSPSIGRLFSTTSKNRVNFESPTTTLSPMPNTKRSTTPNPRETVSVTSTVPLAASGTNSSDDSHHIQSPGSGISTGHQLVDELLDSFKLDETYKSTIHIRDPAELNNLLGLIKKDGKSKLQVITDFDATLTKSHSPTTNLRCVSSSGVITRSALIPPHISNQFIQLYEHYYPIESSPTLPLSIKFNHMIAWYNQTRNLMSQTGITYPKLLECVNISNMQLRDGTLPLMNSLLSQSIPILIFSAGIGNVIDLFLKIQNGGQDFGPDLVIISNFIKFNSNGEFDGYEDLLIHPLNKNEGVMKGEGCQVRGYFERLKGRRNAIVIGDQGHDGEMWKGMEEVGGVVKIGFLNEDISTRLSQFMSIFDVVLVQDQTMKFVNRVFDVILK